jgi:hypothetical protein
MADAPKEAAPVQTGGGRSVNYPGISLETAVERAQSLWNAVGKGSIPIPSAAQTWGYDVKSSGVRTAVSALKQFGLIQDEGSGDNREIRLTDRALDIIHPHDPSQRDKAIQAAALAPKIYSDIFAKFPLGLPTQDHIISAYLLRDKEFNRKTVDSFISTFRANLAYAKVPSSGKMPEKKDGKAKDGDKKQEIEVGDYIQWELSGQLRLPEAARVRAVTEHDGAKWLFVDGSESGIPMAEAILERKGEGQTTPAFGNAPRLPFVEPVVVAKPTQGEREWLRGPLSRDGDVAYRLFVTGKMTEKELGKLIRILQAQKEVMEDFDEVPEDSSKAS